MTENKKKMNEHWAFLEAFLHEADIQGAVMELNETVIRHIEYGFKLAWPHAWKHGESAFWDKYDKAVKEKKEP